MKLSDYLQQNKPQGFDRVPYYSPEADTLTCYFADRDCYAERVDDLLTVYLDTENDELVGCKIKGVQRLYQLLGRFHVVIDDDVPLGSFFLAGLTLTKAEYRAYYERCGEKSEGAMLNQKLLQPC